MIRIVNYLPKIDEKFLYEMILTKNWNELKAVLDNNDYERVGLDRLLTILNDIDVTFGKNDGFRILDVGCNNGFFSVGLSAFGNNVVGLDSYVINTQNRYENLEFSSQKNIPGLQFVNQDILPFLEDKKDESWDFVMLLSVAHQWEFGYAHSGEYQFSYDEIKFIVNWLFSKTNCAIYYECPFDEPGFELGYGFKYLEKYLDNIEHFIIELIDETVGSNGFPRQLYRIERRA